MANEKCSEKDCNNKLFKYDIISPIHKVLVCRKHYYMYAYGLSESEASKK